MKTFVAIIFLTLFALKLSAQYETPGVDISTAKSGSRVTTYSGSGNTHGTQTDHILAVAGKIHFFHVPKDGYQIQCFFMAKSDAGGKQYIFDVQKKKETGQVAEFSFEAPPLTGTTQQWTAIPHGTSGGETITISAVKGSRFEGWIIRIVVDGRVVRVDANQLSLSSIATEREQLFTDAIEKKK